MSQLETMSITEAHGNGEGITATGMEKLETVDNVSMKVDVATTNGDDMEIKETENEDDHYKIGAIYDSAAAQAAMLKGVDLYEKPAPVPATPKKVAKKRGGTAAATSGPATPKKAQTPKGGKKRAVDSDLPDEVATAKKAKIEAAADPENPDAASSTVNGVNGVPETQPDAETKTPKAPKTPKTPKAPKTPKVPKSPKTPKAAKGTTDDAGGEQKSTGRKRASPEKPATSLSIPLSWDTAEEHDRKMVDMKKDGATWGEINKMWFEVTGRVAKGSTLPNRYIRLMANFAQLKPGEAAMLLAAVEKYEKEKWQLVAGFMETVDEKKYAAAFLQKEYKKIQDAMANGTFVPTTVAATASANESAMDEKDEEAKNGDEAADADDADIKDEGGEGMDVE